jgi:hypothetical protein
METQFSPENKARILATLMPFGLYKTNLDCLGHNGLENILKLIKMDNLPKNELKRPNAPRYVGEGGYKYKESMIIYLAQWTKLIAIDFLIPKFPWHFYECLVDYCESKIKD